MIEKTEKGNIFREFWKFKSKNLQRLNSET